MDDYRSFEDGEVAGWAEVALTQAFDMPVSLSRLERLSKDDRRNRVLRAQALIGGNVRSVILKATRVTGYSAGAPDAFAASGLVKEWVARDLLKHSPSHEASSLLAGDRANGLIVFNDFGAGLSSLVRSLREGTAAEAEAGLAAYAQAMARLHAATIGCRQWHSHALAAAFPHAAAPGLFAVDWLERPMPELAGQALPTDEFEMLRAHLADPGPWLALVHGDGCPDNVLLDEDGARLIDFEFSAPGHMLLDAIYWRLGFPSCWCAGMVPEAVIGRIEALYRQELASVFPLVADEAAFTREVTTLMIARTLFSLSWMLHETLVADKVWGTATRRNRILWYLKATIRACEHADMFPRLTGVLAAWLKHLRQAWIEVEPLAYYPAFENGT